MAIKDTLIEIRERNGLTQAEMAERLFVTRQAVSRWECGDTQPGIDALKLIAAEFHVPIEKLLDMPLQAVCQSCGMPLTAPEQFGKNADGTTNGDYCVYCCPNGEANMTGTLDEMIDFCTPIEVKLGLFPDEKTARDALSRYLPTLKRWRG